MFYRILNILSWFTLLGNSIVFVGFLGTYFLADHSESPPLVVIFGYEALLVESGHIALFFLYLVSSSLFAYGYMDLYYDYYRKLNPDKAKLNQTPSF